MSLSRILGDKVLRRSKSQTLLAIFAKISGTIAEDSRPIDWSEKDRMLVLADPMFRFFLKWRLAKNAPKEDQMAMAHRTPMFDSRT
jgi:hypothetical protein